MKRRLAAAMTAAIFVFGTSACTSGVEEAAPAPETVTVQPTPTEDTPEVPEISPDGSVAEAVFPDVIRKNTDSFDHASDEQINSLARTMCDAWGEGASFAELATIMLENDFSPRDAGFFIGAGTAAFCPEFSSQIDSSGTNL